MKYEKLFFLKGYFKIHVNKHNSKIYGQRYFTDGMTDTHTHTQIDVEGLSSWMSVLIHPLPMKLPYGLAHIIREDQAAARIFCRRIQGGEDTLGIYCVNILLNLFEFLPPGSAHCLHKADCYFFGFSWDNVTKVPGQWLMYIHRCHPLTWPVWWCWCWTQWCLSLK